MRGTLSVYRGRWALGLALPVVLSLTGAKCVVVGSSGGTSRTDAGLVVVVRTGSFAGPRVSGLRYTTGRRSGFTDSNGTFDYDDGDSVQFAIGDLDLGRPVLATERITVLDLAVEGGLDNAAVINLARFLLSLDSEPENDDLITIPRQLDDATRLDNPEVASLLQELDFSDEVNFDSVAANLLALLTADYGFTASLVDSDRARSRLARDLS